MDYISITELAKTVEVKANRIRYHEQHGGLSPPQRIGGRAVYAPGDVARVQEYFEQRQRYQRSENA